MTEQKTKNFFSKQCHTIWQFTRQSIRRIFKWAVLSALSVFALLCVVDFSTGYLVKDKIYTDIQTLPPYENALVLGTAKYYSKGVPNLYYKYRLEAALELYQQGKIKKLLLSGDNKTPYYNEPKTMRTDLSKMGVKNAYMEQDFAGYRTLDSVIRAKKVYHLEPFIIITQEFHCERALFIAKTHNINAVCFAAKYPEGHIKVRLREFIARVGMLYDYLKGVMPETLDVVESV